MTEETDKAENQEVWFELEYNSSVIRGIEEGTVTLTFDSLEVARNYVKERLPLGIPHRISKLTYRVVVDCGLNA